MRPIDADELEKYMTDIMPENTSSAYIKGIIEILTHLINFIRKEMPTIEAEPVRHGRWIEKPPYSDETVKGLEFQIVCSRCDEQNSSITFDENSVPIAKTFYRTKFCPNCGARMDADHIDDVSKKVGGADNGNG